MLTCLFLSDAMCTTDRCILFILLLFSVLNKDLLFIMPALLHYLHRNQKKQFGEQSASKKNMNLLIGTPTFLLFDKNITPDNFHAIRTGRLGSSEPRS
jgi:hypothetical protein